MGILKQIKKVGIIPMLYKFKHLYLRPSAEVVSICSREGAYEYMLRYQHACDKNRHYESYNQSVLSDIFGFVGFKE
jgi:hypothetical protein